MPKKQSGFIHLVIIIVLLAVVVTLLVFVWLRAQQHSPIAQPSATVSTKTTSQPSVPGIPEPANISANTAPKGQIGIWSGYVANNAVYQSVEGRLKVPVVTCNNDEESFSAWVGFDGMPTATVEQTGITASCTSAANYSKNPPVDGVYYYAWSLMYGSVNDNAPVFNIAVKPGDIIDYKVTYSDSEYNMTVADITTNQTQTDSEQCVMDPTVVASHRGGCTQNSVEWIIERSGDSKLAEFGTVQLYDDTATDSDGTTRYIEGYPNEGYDMVNNAGLLLAQTSPLTAKGTFAVTWEASGDTGD